MNKEQVVNLLGEPESVSAKGQLEYFNYTYNLGPISGLPAPGGADEYFVRFKEGKVESYGRLGDFDSTKDPANNVNIQIEDKRTPSSK